MDEITDSGNSRPRSLKASGRRVLGSIASTSLQLLRAAQRGRNSAADALFGRLLPSMTRWARGQLPRWARARMDTDDLVQEAFGAFFRRMEQVEPRRRGAIRTYLRQSIRHRIRDEVRRAGKVEVPMSEEAEWAAAGTSPYSHALSAENLQRYRDALGRLSDDEQQLIVGRVELDYSYDQLALATGRRSRDAARMAVRRALLHLAVEMDADA